MANAVLEKKANETEEGTETEIRFCHGCKTGLRIPKGASFQEDTETEVFGREIYISREGKIYCGKDCSEKLQNAWGSYLPLIRVACT